MLDINGQTRTDAVPAQTVLMDYLQQHCRLNSVHAACDTAQCGACTVLVDGKPHKSCNLLLAQVQGSAVRTVESLATADVLHPIQIAFSQHHALQCGYCTPGLIMRTAALINEGIASTDLSAIAHAIEGNLCRCTGYEGIINAISDVLAQAELSQHAQRTDASV